MRYRTIVADPPWEYDNGFPFLMATGKDHNAAERSPFTSVGLPYPAMTLDEICGLSVGDEWAAGDCRLFLWTTNKYLPWALGDVLPSWGFDYRQTLVWHKTEGGPFVSSVAPNTAEFLLVATTGNPRRTGAFPSSVIKVGPKHRHSAKPEAFTDYIEQVSPGPYLELFARRNRLGWDTWGNEALEMVEL